MARSKTFGWVQDAGKLSSCKLSIVSFMSSEGVSTKESQELITDALEIKRWANECYLRLLEALGFLEYDREYDSFIITPLGKDLASSDKNNETTILEKALLSYPPACRVLSLINKSEIPLSKFHIGESLGFTGEAGFTHYKFKEYASAYIESDNPTKVRSNKEGTVDKYARMIAGYLVELGWAKKEKYEETIDGHVVYTPHAYIITEKGRTALRRASGIARESKVIKNISYEMLASAKQPGYEILRKRRSLILEYLLKNKGTPVQFKQIEAYFRKNEAEISLIDYKNEINNIENLGVLLTKIDSNVYLNENLNLNFPLSKTSLEKVETDTENLIKKSIDDIDNIDADFIKSTIKNAFGGRNFCKEFEDDVFKAFNQIIGLDGELLGGHFKREPDSLLWYKVQSEGKSYGVIVDAKAYSKGFKINTDSSRQMKDYIYRFSKRLKEEHGLEKTYFVWAISKYSGTDDDIKDFTEEASDAYQRECRGAVIEIDKLLKLGSYMKYEKNYQTLERILSISRSVSLDDIPKVA